MKTFLAAAALAGITIASISAASAQSPNRSYWNGYPDGRASYAAQPPIGQRISPSTNRAHDVYDAQGYVGSDPDASIRDNLTRDIW
jgi:opacity protein-like surface antigen